MSFFSVPCSSPCKQRFLLDLASLQVLFFLSLCEVSSRQSSVRSTHFIKIHLLFVNFDFKFLIAGRINSESDESISTFFIEKFP